MGWILCASGRATRVGGGGTIDDRGWRHARGVMHVVDG